MVPSGPPTPIGGAQSVTPSLLRSNSGMLGAQGGSIPSHGAFSSLVSPRTQFSNANLSGNVPNVSTLLNQSFGNGGGPNPGIPGGGSGPRSGIDSGAESNSLSGIGSGMGFDPSLSGSQMLADQSKLQQIEPQNQNFQHSQQPLLQFSANHQQSQFQSARSGNGLGSVLPVKLEPPMPTDQHGSQSLKALSQVKLEPQQLQTMRGIGPMKIETQHSDQSLFLQQQQQQQQHLLQQISMSRQSPQVAAAAAAQFNILQQQRFLQLQQHQQQQQLLRAMPHQRSQIQQQLSPQNLPLRSPLKPNYEPGMCARRLTQYMYQQQHRPEDNNIEFWRKFVAEYFAANAKKKWCVSMYGSGRQTTGVFPQDVWHCEICKCKPGRGFEATVEVLPRLFKIKYESGTLEELMYVDMPREYHNHSGQIVLDYAKAIQESVFEQLRVVRDGQLRIVFSQDLKICSWEFCARKHEELIPRRLLIPQVTQLGAAAQKYQTASQNSSSNVSTPDLQSNCNMFVASARQLAKALEVPLVNDLGYTKRYVRCLQISEVVNSMKDLIDYSRVTREGPMESLAKFPRRMGTYELQSQNQQLEQQQYPQQQSQQAMIQNPSNNDQSSVQADLMQVASTSGATSVHNNPLNLPSTSTTAQNTVSGFLRQNSMNSRPQNPMSNANSPYGGSTLQMPSPGSSTLSQQPQPQPQPNLSQFQSPPTPSSSNNPPHTPNASFSANSPMISNIQQATLSGEADTTDNDSSVQKIIQDMMMNSQMNMGSLSNVAKNVNLGNSLVGNGPTTSNPSMGAAPLGNMGGVGMTGQYSMINGMRRASMNGRVSIPTMMQDISMSHVAQQQELGSQMLSGVGAINGFNDFQFDWKPSP